MRIHVPPKMEDSPPLLLLFDGQNVFGDEGSFAGGWQAHGAVDRLPRTVARPLVAAFDHGGTARMSELWSHLNQTLDAIERHLLPALRARYGVGAVIPGGASLGGLAALAAHLRRPQVYGGALAMSPSLWVGRGAIFEELPHQPHPNARLYLDMGQREKGQMWPLALRLAAILRQRGFDEAALRWRPDARGVHNERHWRRRLPAALRHLFRRAQPAEKRKG